MTQEIVVAVLVTVLGSTALNTMITRWFRKGNDRAHENKTQAEASNVLAKAAETTLTIMQTTIQAQDDRIRSQDVRIQRLEDQVLKLTAELMAYRQLHGPLSKEHWDVVQDRT
jgi:hypothetical protein